MITVLRETEERARVIVNNEERLVEIPGCTTSMLFIMSTSFGVMQDIIIMYPTYVTVRLAGREYIKQRGVERSLALVAGPDVSATSIDM